MSERDVAALLSHRQLAAAIDGVADRVVMFDTDDRLLLGNKAWWDEQADFGLKPEIGISYRDYVSDLAASGFIPQAVGKEQEWVSLRLAKRQEAGEAIEVPLANGEVAVIRDHRLPDGGTLTITTTITERIRAETALAASERRFQNLAEQSVEGIVVHRDNRPLYANQVFADMIGFASPAEVLAMTSMDDYVAPAERDRMASYRQRRTGGEEAPESYEFQALRRDGQTIWLEVRVNITEWEGAPAIQSMHFDVTERHQAALALEASEARFKHFAEAGSDWYWETDAENRFTALFGGDKRNPIYRPDFSIGKTRFDMNSVGDPRERREAWRRHLDALDARVAFRDFVYPVDIGDGGRYWLRTSGVPVVDDGGVFCGYRGVTSDITAEIKANEQAHSTRQELATAINSMSDAVVMWDSNDSLTLANRAWLAAAETAGITVSIGMSYVKFMQGLLAAGFYPDAAGREKEWLEERHEDRRNPGAGYELNTPLGTSYLVRHHALPDGGLITFSTDITERKQAEVALRESGEKLHQSQKMEVVGQLTGGVAHDFNNLLTVVQGNLEMLNDRILGDDIARKFTASAISSVQRGATLVDRLLAFSRKQALMPKVVDADALLYGMTDLLRRTLEESIDIDMIGGDDLWRCEVDPGYLENAILNLAINARDAMSGSRRLLIETANVELDDSFAATQAEVVPGQYVMIGVTDSGIGMSRDVIDRVFEPFFTTKDVGAGSGLGLSMVYGFVKQSRGHVAIYSEPGVGTTVKLYMPRSEYASEEIRRAELTDIPNARGETILVVEDDADVRSLSVALLRDLGYETLEAADAISALAILTGAAPIQLLFTDVVLPGGMSGPELAIEVQRSRPEIKILCTSGYTEKAIGYQGWLDDGFDLLDKPYTKADLARRLRAVIDRPGS